MTTTRGKIQYDVTARTAQFTSAMQKVDSRLKGIQGNLKGIAAFAGGAFAIGRITSFIGESVKAFEIQEQAQAKLKTALRGNLQAYKELEAQAKALQKVTLFGDEATIEAQAQLAALRLNKDEIKQLTPLVQDLAVLMKMDLGSAAALVAKSVGSSTNALARYGIEITGAVGSSERLITAIENISRVAGGQAMAQALETQTGKITQLKNAWGDVKEVIGEAAVNVGFFLADAFTRGQLSMNQAVNKSIVDLQRVKKNTELYKNSIFGLKDAVEEVADTIDRRRSSLDLAAIFASKGITKGPGALVVKGIKGPNIEGGVKRSDFGLSSETLREVQGYTYDISGDLESIKSEMADIGTPTGQWGGQLMGVQSVLTSINAILGVTGERMSGIGKILQFLLVGANIASSIASVATAFSPAGVAKGAVSGLGNVAFKQRGSDLIGVVNRGNNLSTSIGVV